jgi:hypothetical protein
VKSLCFLARYFSVVPFDPLSIRVWWPFEMNRTCTPVFGSGYAGLGQFGSFPATVPPGGDDGVHSGVMHYEQMALDVLEIHVR